MPSKPAHEIVKVIGGIAWLGGLILLLVNAPLGVLVLLIAFVLSILSLVWTRQRLTDVNGSSTEPRVAPVSWLAVGVGYALAAWVFVVADYRVSQRRTCRYRPLADQSDIAQIW